MTPWTSRAPGMVGAAREDRDSYFGIIADGFHLHPATLRLAIRAKATGKAALVTDAMPSVGAANKSFELNGETIVADAGRCVTAGGTLAGSDIGMIEAVRYTAAHGGVDMYEALRMGSRYPANSIGLGDTLGSIKPGYVADMIELDDEFNVVRSWIAGDRVDH
jgi:N-acetylglucosamine-6-phosphate deacetylase